MLVTFKRRKLIIIVGVVLVGVFAVFLRGHKEPSYKGRSLSEWLVDLDSTQFRDPKREEASQAAVRQMGTNVLPYLLRDMEDAPAWQEKLVLLSRQQSVVKLNWKTSKERKRQAALAFEALGPLGKEAVPKLNQLLLRGNPMYVASSLGEVGRDGVPSLISALGREDGMSWDYVSTVLANVVRSKKASRHDAAAALPFAVSKLASTDENVRGHAVMLIESIRLEPDLCVPALTKGLQDPSPPVAAFCAKTLPCYGPDARSAIPALTQAEAASDPKLRLAASNALSQIRAMIAASGKIPKLVESLSSTNISIRLPAIQALGDMQSDAGAAVPGVIACMDDSDFGVRHAAIQSLGQIAAMPEQTVPVLRKCLSDENKYIRLAAAKALGEFGWDARSCVPEMLKAAQSDTETRGEIIGVLRLIDPEAAMKVEAK